MTCFFNYIKQVIYRLYLDIIFYLFPIIVFFLYCVDLSLFTWFFFTVPVGSTTHPEFN